EEQVVAAAVDLARLARVVEDRRALPGRALDAVVLAEAGRSHDEAVRLVLVAAAVLDDVRARAGLVDLVGRADRRQPRVVDRQRAAARTLAQLDRDLDRLVLRGPRVVERARIRAARALARAAAPLA